MSHRANLILHENNQTHIYFSAMSALFTTKIMAQGFDYCKWYFQQYDKVTCLLDNAWAEGGLLIDADHKYVLIYGGGEDINICPALQRHFIKRMQPVWPDWQLAWSAKGNPGFAEYLGLPVEDTLTYTTYPEYEEWLDEPVDWMHPEKDYDPEREQNEVITIIANGIVTDYMMDWGIDGLKIPIPKGPELKDIIPDKMRITQWQNEVYTHDMMLADYDNKKIYVCWGCDADDRHVEAIEDYWPGWQAERQTEGLLFHFRYTNRDYSLVEITDEYYKNFGGMAIEGKHDKM